MNAMGEADVERRPCACRDQLNNGSCCEVEVDDQADEQEKQNGWALATVDARRPGPLTPMPEFPGNFGERERNVLVAMLPMIKQSAENDCEIRGVRLGPTQHSGQRRVETVEPVDFAVSRWAPLACESRHIGLEAR